VISHVTKKFRKAFQALPLSAQRQAREVYRVWKQDPYNQVFHFKQIHQSKPIYSIRIGAGHRALGLKRGGLMVWFWIGSHAEYDRIMLQL